MAARLDYGKTPFRNPLTGDIYIDEDGSTILIEGEELTVQECEIAIETVRGEEAYDIEYGFPLWDVIKNPFNLEKYSLLRNAILSTLVTEKIPTLHEAVIGDMQYDDGIWKIEIVIRSINGFVSRVPFEVDLPFLQ